MVYRIQLGQEENEYEAIADKFETRGQIMRAMKDERYHRDPAFRKVVHELLRNTPDNVLGVNQPDEEEGNAKYHDAFKANVSKMFGDPRYDSDPAYRLQVEQYIKDNSAAIAPFTNDIKVGTSALQIQMTTRETGPEAPPTP